LTPFILTKCNSSYIYRQIDRTGKSFKLLRIVQSDILYRATDEASFFQHRFNLSPITWFLQVPILESLRIVDWRWQASLMSLHIAQLQLYHHFYSAVPF
jgi:hypothetical protein